MAITKVKELENVIVNNTTPVTMTIISHNVIDDPDDDSLPVKNLVQETLNSTDDISSQPTLVQTIATAIWS